VRRGPKGTDEGGAAELTKGGEEAVAVAQNTMRGGCGSATGMDERPREGEGCSWCASKGERRGGGEGRDGVGWWPFK
jgi:hypothetical protein